MDETTEPTDDSGSSTEETSTALDALAEDALDTVTGPGLADGFLSSAPLSADTLTPRELDALSYEFQVRHLQRQVDELTRQLEEQKQLVETETSRLQGSVESVSGQTEDSLNDALLNANIALFVLVLVCIGFGAVLVRSYIRRLLAAPPSLTPPPQAKSPLPTHRDMAPATVTLAEAPVAALPFTENKGETAELLLSDPPQSLVQQALERIQDQQYEAAMSLLDLAIAGDAGCADAFFNRGALRAMQGQYEKALVDFDRAMALTPEHPDIYFNRGIALLSLKRFSDAIEDFDRAEALGCDKPVIHGYRARAHLKLGQVEAAVADFEKALAYTPDALDVNVNYGLALMKMFAYTEALERFEAASRIDPQYAEAYLHQANALACLGRKKDARAALQKATELKPALKTAVKRMPVLDDLMRATA